MSYLDIPKPLSDAQTLRAEVDRLRVELAKAEADHAFVTLRNTRLRAVVEAAKAARPEDWMDLPSIHRLIDLYKALDALEVPE